MTDKYVGYGHPPEHGKFKKGQSGNPRGRPKKKLEDPLDIFGRVLKESAVVTVNGEKHIMSQQEILIRQLHKKASEGDLQSMKLLIKFMVHAYNMQDAPKMNWFN